MKTQCVRCGGKAFFSVIFSEPAKKGGKERSEAPVPLVWECSDCQFISPLVLCRNRTQ